MFIDLLSWCVLLIVAIAAVEYFRLLFTSSPGEEPEDDDGEAMKEACRYDFRKFCEYYLAETFHDTFTPRQAKTIAGLQSVVLFGGHGQDQVHRGDGATSMTMAAAIWAAAYRHRAFIVVLTGQASAAATMRHQVESELWHNERLWEDFYPQVDPWPPIEFLSITESLRGVVDTNAEGRRIRPDCVLADSIGGWSRSPAEIENRRRAFQRFVGDLHFRQPGGKPLAIAELEGIEVEPRSTLAGLTAEQLRAKYARPADPQPIKEGQAYVILDDPEGDPPAAPRDPETEAEKRHRILTTYDLVARKIPPGKSY